MKCVKVIKLNSQLHCCAGLGQIEGKAVQLTKMAVLFPLTETEMTVNRNTSIPLTKTETKTEIHAKTEIETEIVLHFC